MWDFAAFEAYSLFFVVFFSFTFICFMDLWSLTLRFDTQLDFYLPYLPLTASKSYELDNFTPELKPVKKNKNKDRKKNDELVHWTETKQNWDCNKDITEIYQQDRVWTGDSSSHTQLITFCK